MFPYLREKVYACHSHYGRLISQIENRTDASDVSTSDKGSSTDIPQKQKSFQGQDPEKDLDTSFSHLNDFVWEIYAPPDKAKYNMEIVFIHGLQTSCSKRAWRTTWTNRKGKCWPRELLAPLYPDARILSISYDASSSETATQGRSDLYQVTENLESNLFLAEVGQKCPLLLVGHGFGCLIIKNLMTRANRKVSKAEENLVKNVGAYVFYSPVSGGVTDEGDIFTVKYTDSSEMKKLQAIHNPQISRLNLSFAKQRKSHPVEQEVLVLGESHQTAIIKDGKEEYVTCVSEASARADCNKFYQVSADYHDVCKHEKTEESAFQMFIVMVEQVLEVFGVRPPPELSTPKAWMTDILPEEKFRSLFLNKDCFYTYEAFIKAFDRFPKFGFGTTGNDEQRKREIAAFLAHIDHCTSGLMYIEERTQSAIYIDCPHGTPYCKHSNEYGCLPGKKYYGRGPIQLSWNYNYKNFGLSIDRDLVSEPDLVSQDAVTSFASAIWFWCTRQWNKPSCHDVMTGNWEPTEEDERAKRYPGFGVTTNIMNGGEECHKVSAEAKSRSEKYKKFCMVFKIDPGQNLDTVDQWPFDGPVPIGD